MCGAKSNTLFLISHSHSQLVLTYPTLLTYRLHSYTDYRLSDSHIVFLIIFLLLSQLELETLSVSVVSAAPVHYLYLYQHSPWAISHQP